ncbi:hypothetical protein ACJJID_05730 [Microbulbifer sp. CnH-101-G]|uniref:hypothetical protein n=1 Tax=Microbulbifer sp. CnH-101-G TaxID=3243393 RepID=UPI00403A0B05
MTGASVGKVEALKQILDANRIPYICRKDGSPALTWEIVNQATLARGTSKLSPASSNLPEGFILGAAK